VKKSYRPQGVYHFITYTRWVQGVDQTHTDSTKRSVWSKKRWMAGVWGCDERGGILQPGFL